MPKNKGRGGKNRKKGKNENVDQKRELIYKEDGFEYAQVRKMLGNGRLEAYCFDGVTRLGHIIGKLRKKVWITTGDVILVAKRDFQDEKCEVVHKYLPEEVRSLKAYGEIPESIKVDEEDVGQVNPDIDVNFQDSSEEEEAGSSEEEKKNGKKKKPAEKAKESSDESDDLDDV